jgi:Ca-activated chloride channel homolog
MLNVRLVLVSLLGAAAFSLAVQQPAMIRTDVNLVQLHVKVTDPDGHTVTGLPKDAFKLLVDDQPQPISDFHGDDAPVTAGLVIDNSASMAPKRQDVIAGALAFARASNPKDQMFVVHFNSSARLGLPENTPFTGDVTELEHAVAAFDLGGTTALYDALMLSESRFRQAMYPLKVLLTISDGGDNSSHATLAQALDGAVKAGIVIYSVGIFDEDNRDRNPQVLTKIGEQTGGAAFFPEHVSDVARICTGIAEDIRRQYTLGFTGAEDGLYHRIRLIVTDPNHSRLEVRTRPGYIAAKPR